MPKFNELQAKAKVALEHIPNNSYLSPSEKGLVLTYAHTLQAWQLIEAVATLTIPSLDTEQQDTSVSDPDSTEYIAALLAEMSTSNQEVSDDDFNALWMAISSCFSSETTTETSSDDDTNHLYLQFWSDRLGLHFTNEADVPPIIRGYWENLDTIVTNVPNVQDLFPRQNYTSDVAYYFELTVGALPYLTLDDVAQATKNLLETEKRAFIIRLTLLTCMIHYPDQEINVSGKSEALVQAIASSNQAGFQLFAETVKAVLETPAQTEQTASSDNTLVDMPMFYPEVPKGKFETDAAYRQQLRNLLLWAKEEIKKKVAAGIVIGANDVNDAVLDNLCGGIQRYNKDIRSRFTYETRGKNDIPVWPMNEALLVFIFAAYLKRNSLRKSSQADTLIADLRKTQNVDEKLARL